MDSTTTQPIGIFDSGFGGLDIFRAIKKTLPEYDYIYLADSARAPYGDRGPAQIYQYTQEAVAFLCDKNCQLIIIACNTASSDALRKIQQEYIPQHYPDRKVLGVLIPGAEEAVTHTKNKRVGVMATRATVDSGAFVRELKKLDPTIHITQVACPLLVPAIEQGKLDTDDTQLLIQTYTKPLIDAGVDTIILGCTHYGIIESTIKNSLPSNITVISEATIVATKLHTYLERHPEIKKTLSRHHTQYYYTTGDTTTFNQHGSIFLGQTLESQQVILG